MVTGDRADEILHSIQESSINAVNFNAGKGAKKRNLKKSLDEICVQEVEKHRKNLLEILLNSNATPIRHRGDQGYSCCFCADQYPIAADLKKHTMDEHDADSLKNVIQEMRIYTVKLDITDLKCATCHKDLSTIEELMEHLAERHKRTIYTDIKNHMIPFKFEDDNLKCAMCTTKCSTFRNLTEHMNTHYRNYVCIVCGAGFVNRDILRSHKRIHRTGNFSCDFCPKTFNTLVKKQSHVNVVHKHSYMTRKCGYCNELFIDYRKKNEHLAKVHGVKLLELKCDVCNKSFTNQTSLTTHTRKDHLMERNFKCNVCEMKFFSRKDLAMHMLRHTGQRDYHCELCGKAFARKFTLNQHMRVHNKERQRVKKESADKYLIIMDSDETSE